MALFLRGRMNGFYKAGTSDCVRDTWRFYRTNENKIHSVMTRRDMESSFGRFWKYQDTRINLIPVDESQPRLGGRVQATQKTFNVQTLTFSNKHYHGVYGEDFISFGQFTADVDVDNEETLLKIFDEDSDAVFDRHYFKFDNGQVSYSRKIDGEHIDAEIEHAIEETPLQSVV